MPKESPVLKITYLDNYPDSLPHISPPRVGDVGYDIFSTRQMPIMPNSVYKMSLGFSAEIPNGYYAQLSDRSSVASQGLMVIGGVIDPSYRGEWGLIIVNPTNSAIYIRHGQKIAQFILTPYAHVDIVEVERTELTETERGANGFGSTGE